MTRRYFIPFTLSVLVLVGSHPIQWPRQPSRNKKVTIRTALSGTVKAMPDVSGTTAGPARQQEQESRHAWAANRQVNAVQTALSERTPRPV